MKLDSMVSRYDVMKYFPRYSIQKLVLYGKLKSKQNYIQWVMEFSDQFYQLTNDLAYLFTDSKFK